MHFYWFISILTVSCFQAIILAYGDFGEQTVSANLDRLLGVRVPSILILEHLHKQDIWIISFSVMIRAILLFPVQCIPAFIYDYYQSIRGKKIAAFVIWILPALIALPTLKDSAMYLISPLFSVGFLISLLSDQFTKEDFSERLVFRLAVIGWFNLFWLVILIRNWIFPLCESRAAR
jgi:hypothetical protein